MHGRSLVSPASFQVDELTVVGVSGNVAGDLAADTKAANQAELWVNVSVPNGGTLNVSLQASSKGDEADITDDDDWVEVGTLGPLTTAGPSVLTFVRGVDILGNRMRLVRTVTVADMTFEATLLIKE